MRYKAVKLARYWSARLRPPALPALFWHIGVPNFGDDINPALFQALTGARFRFAANRNAPHFLGMGSIFAAATEASIVLGAGLLTPAPPVARPHVVALRGKLTQATLGMGGDVPLGDPMVLVDRIFTADRGDVTGFVPHVGSLALARRIVPRDVRLIDVRQDPWQVIREIGRCRRVFSQSLHGLIVADALGVENLWLDPSQGMRGGRFKFDDYFSTLDAPKPSHPMTADVLCNPPLADFSVGRYQGDKDAYHRLLKAAVLEGVA